MVESRKRRGRRRGKGETGEEKRKGQGRRKKEI